MRKHFEYLTLIEKIFTDIEPVLNTYGKQGWELVSVIITTVDPTTNNATFANFFFKRELL